MFQPNKSIIVMIVFTMSATASSLQYEISDIVNIKNETILSTYQKSLEKRSSVEWKLTGTTCYYMSELSGEGSWKFSSRDTIIYDNSGNVIIKMRSNAHKGWNKDSLIGLDSAAYTDNLLNSKVSYVSVNDSLMRKNQVFYNYENEGKTCIIHYSDWEEEDCRWVCVRKDSLINYDKATRFNFFDPNNILINDFKCYSFIFDKTTSSFVNKGFFEKIEETDNRIIIFCKEINNRGDTNKYRFTYYIDSYGNDTLYEMSYAHKISTSTLSRTIRSRDVRSYDNNGNNIMTIEYYSGQSNDSWIEYYKEDNTFAQIDVPVVRSVNTSKINKAEFISYGSYGTFYGSGIKALCVVNAAGRVYASLRQNASSSITLLYNQENSRLSTGAYIAIITCDQGVIILPFIVNLKTKRR